MIRINLGAVPGATNIAVQGVQGTWIAEDPLPPDSPKKAALLESS
jgi:hypothetical protein